MGWLKFSGRVILATILVVVTLTVIGVGCLALASRDGGNVFEGIHATETVWAHQDATKAVERATAQAVICRRPEERDSINCRTPIATPAH